MRILDNNKDFYDYCQGIYPDDSFTYDRRDSYVLSKEEFASYFTKEQPHYRYYFSAHNGIYHILMQVCHSFWLFKLTVLTTDEYNKCLTYDIELLKNWKDFNSDRKLFELSVVNINIPYSFYYNKDRTEEKLTDKMVEAIKIKDYVTKRVFNKFIMYKGNDRVEKHIPILKNTGIASLVDPMEIYLSLEEYFSMEKTANERIDAIGLTNDDKITNHGFDLKTSFRGKVK